MAEIVNLNKARKQRERARLGAEAAANRARHGRRRAERARDAAEAERRARLLAGARLDATGPEEDPTGA